MHPFVAWIAIVWLGLLLLAVAGLVLRRRGYLDRVLALDTFATVLIAMLAVASYARGEGYALDAALLLALLSFVATLAAVRYHQSRRPV